MNYLFKMRQKGFPYFLMLPAVLFVLAIYFYPMLEAIRYSFFRSEYLKMVEFVGFENYFDLLTSSEFLLMLRVTFIHLISSVILILPISLYLAHIINQRIRFRKTFRTILILPWAISQLIAAFLWKWLLNPYYGPITYLVDTFFAASIPNLSTSPIFAMPFFIFVTVWKFFPLPMLFVLASMQTIPISLYEAAKIDGSSSWGNFWYITFPLIKNTVLVSMVLISIFILNAVSLSLNLTGGGPGNLTKTLALGTFLEAFHFWRMGSASSMAVILLIINVTLSIIYMKIFKTEKYY